MKEQIRGKLRKANVQQAAMMKVIQLLKEYQINI